MQERTLKTEQRSLEQRINTSHSIKKPLSFTKKSNVRGMLPRIEVPAAKRHAAIKQIKEAKNKNERQSDDELIKDQVDNHKDKKKRKKQERKQQSTSFKIFNYLQKENKTPQSVHEIKKNQKIAQILSFMYNEFTKVEKSNKSNFKVYNEWQLFQIRQNYVDTNLGDFVIKIVNPDNLPQQYLKLKNYDKDKNAKISFYQAMEMYDQVFNAQSSGDNNLENIEKAAFQLAFYLLELENDSSSKSKQVSRSSTNVNQNTKKKVQDFINIFMYLIKIQELNFSQYIEQKKKPDLKQFQASFQEPEIVNAHMNLDKVMANSNQKRQAQQQYSKYKKDIYVFLSKTLQDQYKDGRGIQNDFICTLLKKVSSISQLLTYFPQLIRKFFHTLRHKLLTTRLTDPEPEKDEKDQKDEKKEKNEKNSFTRKFYAGGYLNRVNIEGQLRWIQAKQRPTDVLTLVRKFLIYRLTRRGGLFIREFLSRQQNHIFLIVKASQKHLQKKAQQTNFNMEIQLGSVDIFSFEPIDVYGRPLRCHKYLRQNHFKKKYNLFLDKRDKDEDLGQKSVQSQALNLYHKAMSMNEDELRAKIIIDQDDTDELFEWISLKMHTSYIQKDQILNNKYNEDEVDDDIWPIYYIYNKLICEYLKKLKQQYEMQKNDKFLLHNLEKNVGLSLRLMFLKALNFCNQMYFKHRRSVVKSCSNFIIDKHPLKTIWNQMGEDSPRGYFPYFFSQKNEKVWRKYEINQQKDRSKFTPATRLIITNSIIRQYLNVTKSLSELEIADFYPIHDPFILKHIKIRPFLQVINSLIDNGQNIEHEANKKNDTFQAHAVKNDTFIQYECDYTSEDFTKQPMQQKLRFKWKKMTQFSVNTIAFYCGEKLAFFFQFRRFLTEKAWPLVVITFIIQIIFWKQNSDIASTGSSDLTSANNVLMVIMTIINIIWVQKTIADWQNREKSLARSFGTNVLQSTKTQKRVLFQGQMQRNLQTDEINDREDNKCFKTMKTLIALFINIMFVLMMASIILLIITLRITMFQLGLSQSLVTNVPSILISLSIQILSYLYNHFIIGVLVHFENKKTVLQYEDSLISKSFIVTFIVTYFVLIVYGFFEQYFQGQFVCSIVTSQGVEINNCYYFMANQVVTNTLTDLALTIVMAFLPYVMFLISQWRKKEGENRASFNLNYFQSIDCFYEEQDKMQNYMYTDQIDRTWEGYNQITIAFTTLVLFAPIVPFLYLMMFLVGVVSLNAKKREIIYFSKRTLPIKVKTIGFWLKILKAVSVVGVFFNIALIIFVRNAIADAKSIVYFSCVFVVLVLKYIFSFESEAQDHVGKRCKTKIGELISERNIIKFTVKNQNINTDIQNVYYNEMQLKRNLPVLKAANFKYK